MFADLLEQVTRAVHHYELRRQHPTERETIDKLVLPFIGVVLGVDYRDPTAVTAEFDADIGRSKGEKVDYAIHRDGEPAILIECKALDTPLDGKAVQLQRYIGALPQVSLGILTDGRRYRFFADLDNPNIMDSEPFFSIDLLNLSSTDERRLQLFHLDHLNVDAVKQKGQGWKAVTALVQALESEWKEPSAGYIAHFARPLHTSGPLTESVRRQYAGYLKEAHRIYLSRHIGLTPMSDKGIGINQEKVQHQSNNKTSSVTTPDEWRPLTELNSTDLTPRIISFGDGSTAEVKNWADLFRTVAYKLASEGYFQPVPADLHKIIKQNPPRTKTPWIKLPDGQYIRNHGSATDRLNITIRLLTASKYNPAKCTVT